MNTARCWSPAPGLAWGLLSGDPRRRETSKLLNETIDLYGISMPTRQAEFSTTASHKRSSATCRRKSSSCNVTTYESAITEAVRHARPFDRSTDPFCGRIMACSRNARAKRNLRHFT